MSYVNIATVGSFLLCLVTPFWVSVWIQCLDCCFHCFYAIVLILSYITSGFTVQIVLPFRVCFEGNLKLLCREKLQQTY